MLTAREPNRRQWLAGPWSALAGPLLGKAAWVTAAALLACLPAVAAIGRQEALKAAYPGAEFEAERVFLSEEQQSRAARLAGVEVPSALIARYLAHRKGRRVGRAYVDTHVVRTKKETLLICLNPDGSVRRIETTAFLEPPEYEAPQEWRRQYRDRQLNDDLNLNRSIRPLAGATLTTRAVNEAVRRVLAIDQVLQADAKPAREGRP
ncbi:MAG TPA: FMN-binding protein [Acidobacteriota bacterium]|nr:FMN-binding protein [Acidobacteriota bacterium]